MALNKTTQSYNDEKQVQADLAQTVSLPSWHDFGTFDYANLANLLHPPFQGVRWTHDQPMPGPFLVPPPSQRKGRGNEVVLDERLAFTP